MPYLTFIFALVWLYFADSRQLSAVMSKGRSYGSTKDSGPLETLGLLEETRRYQMDAEETSGHVLGTLKHQNQQIRNANQHVLALLALLALFAYSCVFFSQLQGTKASVESSRSLMNQIQWRKKREKLGLYAMILILLLLNGSLIWYMAHHHGKLYG